MGIFSLVQAIPTLRLSTFYTCGVNLVRPTALPTIRRIPHGTTIFAAIFIRGNATVASTTSKTEKPITERRPRVMTKIIVPDEVKIDTQTQPDGQHLCTISGPLGTISRVFRPVTQISIADDRSLQIEFIGSRSKRDPDYALWGLYFALVRSMITGVTRGHKKLVAVNGIGYRISVEDGPRGKETSLHFKLGYANPCIADLPEGISADLSAKKTRVLLTSVDAEKLGTFAARIRAFRKPDVYKKKGVRIDNEFIPTKVGKKR